MPARLACPWLAWQFRGGCSTRPRDLPELSPNGGHTSGPPDVLVRPRESGTHSMHTAQVDISLFSQIIDLSSVFLAALLGGVLARADKLDPVGFIVIAIASGLGGGIVRDTLIQKGTPSHSLTPSTSCWRLWGHLSRTCCRSAASSGTACTHGLTRCYLGSGLRPAQIGRSPTAWIGCRQRSLGSLRASAGHP